jgi:hypothetical protein
VGFEATVRLPVQRFSSSMILMQAVPACSKRPLRCGIFTAIISSRVAHYRAVTHSWFAIWFAKFSRAHVRFWHLADMLSTSTNVRFWGQPAVYVGQPVRPSPPVVDFSTNCWPATLALIVTHLYRHNGNRAAFQVLNLSRQPAPDARHKWQISQRQISDQLESSYAQKKGSR